MTNRASSTPGADDGPTAADDEFHPPTTDDPNWTETCWYSLSVPERKLSLQLYPFFRPNLGVMSAGVYCWDEHGTEMWNARYVKNHWHLPIPDQPLSDIAFDNGIRYRVMEPLEQYSLAFHDTDGDSLHAELTFTAVARPNQMGLHIDQPGRYTGTIVLDGETIEVDSFGMRDRSWGVRSQFGETMFANSHHGGYSYGTASDRDGFHAITMVYEGRSVGIHGYLVRDGEWSKAASASREVVERDQSTGFPRRVTLDIVDELGRETHCEGEVLNQFAWPINPNLFTVNCLTRWTFDGIEAYGEDHDNWSSTSIRRTMRQLQGWS